MSEDYVVTFFSAILDKEKIEKGVMFFIDFGDAEKVYVIKDNPRVGSFVEIISKTKYTWI